VRINLLEWRKHVSGLKHEVRNCLRFLLSLGDCNLSTELTGFCNPVLFILLSSFWKNYSRFTTLSSVCPCIAAQDGIVEPKEMPLRGNGPVNILFRQRIHTLHLKSYCLRCFLSGPCLIKSSICRTRKTGDYFFPKQLVCKEVMCFCINIRLLESSSP
jgi:hypothetical protein